MSAIEAPKAVVRGWREFIPSLKQAVIAFFIAAALQLVNDFFFFESVVVPSSSMRPTILRNERIFLRKFAVGAIQRFDVVVIRTPAFKDRIVKRVVGLPGDEVRLDDSYRLFINGKPLEYGQPDEKHVLTEGGHHTIQLVRNPKFFFPTIHGREEFQLGPDEYYVLGDNRLASEDGRTIGPIKRSEIVGKMTFVWYSYDKIDHRCRIERVFKAVY